MNSILKSEGIKDFQIEGISLGDKLTDYLSIDQIISNTKDWYKTKNFYPVQINASIFNSKNYDKLEFNIKVNDNNYITHMIGGIIHFPNNINDCYKKQDELMNDLNKMFADIPGIKIQKPTKYIHGVDITKKSFFTRGRFIFNSGDSIDVDCNDYSNEFSAKNNNQPDEMYIAISSNDFYQFLMSGGAY